MVQWQIVESRKGAPRKSPKEKVCANGFQRGSPVQRHVHQVVIPKMRWQRLKRKMKEIRDK
jgi:hypothetical protein